MSCAAPKNNKRNWSRLRFAVSRPRCWRRNSSAGRLRREGPMIHDQDGDRDQTAAMMIAIGLVMSPLDECRRTTVSIEYRRRRERHVVNRAHRRTNSAAPEEVSQVAAQLQRWMLL